MKTSTLPFLSLLVFLFACLPPEAQLEQKGIHPSKEHNQFWSYNGEEVLLLGASDDDNLFQMKDVATHLELLTENGGNYVRNTMSSRDTGNVWPFQMMEDGLYDLNEFNEEYWNRFETFLAETAARDIVVQIEVWATFDFYRENWSVNPYNPKNTKNLSSHRDKLDTLVATHPIFTGNNFFRSVPTQMSLPRPLYYQQKFVDKLLSYSLNYDHVLYCMDNETSVSADWGRFWADYIKKAAKLKGKTVYCTEMWDPHNLDHALHYETFDHPEIYDFVDISQNNHNTGQKHWDNCLAQIDRLRSLGNLRPVNNVKIYGSASRRFTSDKEGIENFIQNVFAGCASVRFHRPTSGIGLNQQAQAVVKSVRQATDKMNWFEATPSNDLLENREENEAYCRSGGKAFAVYFPNGGEVKLRVGDNSGLSIQWLDVMNSNWSASESLTTTDNKAILTSPGTGDWIAIIK